MTVLVLLLFWGSVLALLLAHVLVPLALRLVPSRPVARGPSDGASFPAGVSVIVSAYNEERHIADKIQDCLRLAVPGGPLEVIAVSDGSTDRTAAILTAIRDPRVRVE